MKKIFSLALVLFAAAALAADPPKPPGMEDGQVTNLADAKWIVPPMAGIPAGVMAAPLSVDPATGASAGYAKIPGGTTFPLHWHSATELTVVLSGKGTLTVDGKASPVSAGAYFVIPAKAQHKLVCDAG